MTPVLDIRGLAQSHGSRTLLAGLDLSVEEGEKVGVIGRNGTGKSTLFRLVAGLESSDEGTVALRRGARVGFLAQDPEMDPSNSVFAAVGAGRPGLDALLEEYDRVNAALAGGDPGSAPEQAELLERHSRLTARIDAERGWDRRHRVEGILTRLGVTGWDRPLRLLSGGERRRVALARTLLSEPDLLLLDEPTNHLDADTVLWLEETLFDFGGAALLVTHDRYFLDRVVDRIVELRDGRLSSFRGGYTEYLEERALREERERAEDRKRARLVEKELAWAMRSPPARTGKQKARRERARELAAEKGRRDSVRARGLEAESAEGPRLGSTVLELHDVSKAYAGRRLLDGVSERILAGECVGVVGPNGVGKTTLLRMVVGEEAPDSGRVVLGETVRVGYLDQSRSLDPEKSVARTVSEADWVEVGGRRTHLRAYLDRFLFPAHVHEQKVRALSGGERTRLLLARLLLEEFNLLLLDEPTNDLDLDTLHVLEDVIEGFEGSVLVVTHDRYLLDKLATSLLVFEGEGRVRRHHGTWDSYLARREQQTATERERLREAEQRERAARREAAREQAREARSGKDRLSYKEARELEDLEERITALEEEAGELSVRLADPSFYRDDPDAIGAVSRRLRQVEEAAAKLYERWSALGDRA